MSGLDGKLRARWDALIETEGKAMGLSDCSVFLENKLVNDIFYEGLFKGRPCVVKCSSRAPESIRNEYEISRRLIRVCPSACATPFAYWSSPDGKYAFVVMERLAGDTLLELIEKNFYDDESVMVAVANGMLRIAQALHKAGIVWRDVFHDNFIVDKSGCPRLIDGQFAVRRDCFVEDAYLLKHWKYRISVFAYNDGLCGRGWNDVGKMLYYLRHLPSLPAIDHVRKEMANLAGVSNLEIAPTFTDCVKAGFFYVELYLRSLFSSASNKKRQLKKRMDRVWKYLYGIPKTSWSGDT